MRRGRAKPLGLGLDLDDLLGRGDDRLGVDLGGAQQLLGLARGRHAFDRKHPDLGLGVVFGQRRQHRLADAALGPVVLDGDDRAGLLGGLDQRPGVDRLDRVEVDDPGRDAAAGELLGGGQRFVQGDAGADERDVVAVR